LEAEALQIICNAKEGDLEGYIWRKQPKER
jgi:hypothetical protein